MVHLSTDPSTKRGVEMFKIDLRDQFKSLATELDLDPSSIRYCLRRLKSEGGQFLTVTLPQLAKCVLKSLELGYFERPTSIQWHERSLRFFRSLLDKIFDPKTGLVLREACPLAIYSIRTLGEYFYKLALPFSEESLQKHEENFVNEDNSLERDSFDWSLIERLRVDFENHHLYSRCTHTHVFKHARPYITNGSFSGRTSDVYYIHKLRAATCPPEFRADSGFFKPYPSLRSHSVELNTEGKPVVVSCGPISVAQDTSTVSQVLFVPKDSRGPRTIVREPMGRLSAQMSFHVWLRDNLTRVSNHRVNFVDQQVNRDLARSSSISKMYSTLDLKSASDRVSLLVIKHITRNSPAFAYFIKHRTSECILPSGKIHTLKKLAGMGSGLTFPTMSLLIYLAGCRAIADQCVSYKDAMKMVYVYGDDIIVPRRYHSHVIDFLGRVGLKVNTEKSFTRSFFRESCGGDYYAGQDVGPLRLKLSNCMNALKGSLLTVSGSSALLQLERHARECVNHGFLNLAELYYTHIERKFGPLPKVGGNSPILGRYTLNYAAPEDCDEFGNVKTKKFLVPLPVKTNVEGVRCPYKFLGSKLNSGEISDDPLKFLDYVTGSTYEEIAIPREQTYGRRQMSLLDTVVG